MRLVIRVSSPSPSPSPPFLLKVLELFGVEGEESISLLSASGRPNINNDTTAEGGDGEDAIESRPSRVFFCAAMACASCFAAMAMTSWARTDG